MSQEPVRWYVAIQVLVQAVLVALVAFGVDLEPEQVAAIMGVAASVTAIIGGIVTRGKVSPVPPGE